MEVFIIIFAVLLMLIIVAFILLSIGVACWIDYSKNDTKIKYRHFRALYIINPNKWRIRDGFYPEYRKNEWRYADIAVRFGFWGTIAYWFFKWGLSHHKKMKKQNDSSAELISCFQKDIDQYKYESKEFINNELKKL